MTVAALEAVDAMNTPRVPSGARVPVGLSTIDDVEDAAVTTSAVNKQVARANEGSVAGAKANTASNGPKVAVGASARLVYEPAPYHTNTDNFLKSRAPVNGQNALDVSLQVKSTSPRRVGIDYEKNEFVVFDKTQDNVYHGHVRSWNDLHVDMQNTLRKAGMVDKKGHIITNK